MIRIAVVLMNLGGPDRLEAVQPFLFNLFSDSAILRLPALFRLPLARIVAWRRAPIDWFVADSSLEETRH